MTMLSTCPLVQARPGRLQSPQNPYNSAFSRTTLQLITISPAPLVLLTLLGLLLMPFAGFSATPPLILALTVNAAGAIGDMIVAGWLFGQSTNTLVRDEGAIITLYKVSE